MPVKKLKAKGSKLKTPSKSVRKSAAVKKELPRETGLKLSVHDLKGKSVGKINLPKEIFGVKVNDKLMAQAVRVYLANQRQGTVSTKTRGEVKGSSRKIYRQKGTGRARHGSIRAPIFVKGGLVFGPKPRDYSMKFPKNMKKAALSSALSAKLRDGEIKIITGFEKIEPKTRVLAQSLKVLGDGGKKRKLLLVTPGADAKNVVRAGRNIEGVSILSANMLNAYSVLDTREIFFMKESIDPLVDCFKKEKANG